MKFTGVGVALVTPFKGKKVNFDVLKDLIDFHLKNKTDFLVILGSTAEAATLSLKEKKQIIDFVVKYANNKIPIVVGSGSNDTAASIAFSKYSEKAGADGLLVVTPYYNKPSQKGLVAHFKAIAKKVSLPIILYNVPSRTAVNLETKTVLELSKIDNIVGIKEASGNLTQVKEIIDACGQDFAVLSGNDEQTLDVLKLGGHGTISVTANIIPGILTSLIKDYFSGKNIDDEFNSFLPLHDAMFIETNPVVVKRALEHMGFVVGSPRLPLLKLEHKHDKILKEVLEKYKLVTND